MSKYIPNILKCWVAYEGCMPFILWEIRSVTTPVFDIIYTYRSLAIKVINYLKMSTGHYFPIKR